MSRCSRAAVGLGAAGVLAFYLAPCGQHNGFGEASTSVPTADVNVAVSSRIDGYAAGHRSSDDRRQGTGKVQGTDHHLCPDIDQGDVDRFGPENLWATRDR